ncbi:type VII secretion integral membrane protein EccD [Mycolicibacterium komossense]|uniref:Type VII secretion integral membrane protein EccD n=1 Tax=Mycolicibacterium komossense TaxID=1779 RepID=A0ABT3CFN8_9MYCO|nr:type VII secretion integral membrane protein EccD [Mycolicibacterium komossense]MCV7228262.1 type VII secretion integral membrane protein EccD [Mycolicibacterium komossense]
MTEPTGSSGTTVLLPIVRVAIVADSRMTEVALPAELPLREILPAVRRLLQTGDDDSADWDDRSTGGAQRLSLAPIGGAPFSLDASLDTVGVVDGDLLALQAVPVGPAAPGIVEDIADAAVIFSESRTKPWGTRHIQAIARTGVVALVAAVTGLAAAHSVVTGAAAGLYVVSALAAATVVAALLLRARALRPAGEVSIVALAPIAAAFVLAIPGGVGAAQVLLAAAGVTAWSLICLILGRDGFEHELSFFTAATVVGAGVLLAAAAASVWQLPLVTLGCGLVVLSLLVTIQAAQLSALWARFPLPVIPAPGDPAPSAPSLQVLEDLPRRVRVSNAHQTGFIAGSVLLAVLGSLLVAGRPEAPGGWGWYLVIAISAAAVLRARVWDTAACKAWLLAEPYLVALALVVVFATQHRYVVASVTLAVLAILVLAWVVVATNPRLASPESYSLPMRRLVGFISSAVDASLIPVMAYLVGIFTWVINR